MRRLAASWRWAAGIALAAIIGAPPALAADAPARAAFKVCQDPNNLPFSNQSNDGYENKIAQLFAADLKLPLEYFSFPNRLAFVRNTLRYRLPGEAYRCDVIIGVPAEFDQVSATRPYYRSTYALVFAKGHGLDTVRSAADFLSLGPERLSKLRIGVVDQSPASLWLVRHNLVDQGVPYLGMTPDTDHSPTYPVQRDLAAGKLDAAILWGPIAGYAAKAHPDLVVVPLESEPGVRLDYAMAMGVRYGEPEWKATVQGLIDRHQAEIEAILRDYSVPLLAAQAMPPAGR